MSLRTRIKETIEYVRKRRELMSEMRVNNIPLWEVEALNSVYYEKSQRLDRNIPSWFFKHLGAAIDQIAHFDEFRENYKYFHPEFYS